MQCNAITNNACQGNPIKRKQGKLETQQATVPQIYPSHILFVTLHGLYFSKKQSYSALILLLIPMKKNA